MITMSSRIGLPPPPYSTNVNRERRVMWCAQETKELIKLAGRLFMNTSSCRKHSKEVYQIISDEMKRRGHHKSLEQCRIKWKHLKGFYFEALQKESEADQLLVCPFFKDLEPILKNTKKGAARGSGSSASCNGTTTKKRDQSVSGGMPLFHTVLINEKKAVKPEVSDGQKVVFVQDPLGIMKQPVTVLQSQSTTNRTPVNFTLSNNQNGLWQQVLLTDLNLGPQSLSIKGKIVLIRDVRISEKNNPYFTFEIADDSGTITGISYDVELMNELKLNSIYILSNFGMKIYEFTDSLQIKLDKASLVEKCSILDFRVPQQKGGSAQPQVKLGSPLVVTQDPLGVATTNSVKSLPATSSPSSLQVNPAPAPTPPATQPVQPATPPEICLKWGAYNNNMRSMFPALLANERFVDVTLACEGQRIKCHKFMLSACSPYFDQLLGENPCRHPIVLLKDLQFWEVQAILDFIYKGEVRIRQDKLPALLAAANCLQIKGLSEQATSSPSSCSNSNSNELNSSRQFISSNEPDKKGKKRKALKATSEPKDSSSSDCESDVDSDDPSRLIVVGSNDEADSTSTSSGIPTTNGTLIKKIKLEKSRSPEKSEIKSKENKEDNPNPEKKKKSCPSNPPNLIKIERSQYPIIPKTEDLSYENDDGSLSPSYYPAFPEALVESVLTEEDSSQ